MEETEQLTDREKELLHVIGKYPDITLKELLPLTSYKWVSTVARKLERLRELGALSRLLYDINFSKLCRNPLYKVVCILETCQSYETVISYLKLIGSLLWIFPVLSSHKNVLQAGFLSSDNQEMTALLQLLKDNDIISDYIVRASLHKRIVENPNLFGDLNPSLKGLLNPCELPDISPDHHDTVWDECDIRILPYLQKGGKLIEILKEEKKINRPWTYEQLRYSREKISKNGLTIKRYVFPPFSCEKCTEFHLFLKVRDTTVLQTILHNFARRERVYKEYSLYGDWGILVCRSHPLFLTGLLYKLDRIDEIREKEMYQTRSISDNYHIYQRIELKDYDFDKQTLEYPYHLYREKIKETLEKELICI